MYLEYALLIFTVRIVMGGVCLVFAVRNVTLHLLPSAWSAGKAVPFGPSAKNLILMNDLLHKLMDSE